MAKLRSESDTDYSRKNQNIESKSKLFIKILSELNQLWLMNSELQLSKKSLLQFPIASPNKERKVCVYLNPLVLCLYLSCLCLYLSSISDFHRYLLFMWFGSIFKALCLSFFSPFFFHGVKSPLVLCFFVFFSFFILGYKAPWVVSVSFYEFSKSLSVTRFHFFEFFLEV